MTEASKKKPVSWATLLPAAVCATFGLLLWQGLQTDSNRQNFRSNLIGEQAPRLPLEAIIGTQLATPDTLRSGQVSVVNFWASWCPPCRAEHPRLLELASDGVRIIGVNFRDTQEQASHYLQSAQNPFIATGFDKTGRISIDWGVIAPPETFIINGQGEILHRFAGPLVGTDVEDRFLPWLTAALQDHSAPTE